MVSNPRGVRRRRAPTDATVEQKLPKRLLFSSPGHLCWSEDASPSWRMNRTLINITCQRQNVLEGRGVRAEGILLQRVTEKSRLTDEQMDVLHVILSLWLHKRIFHQFN